MFLSGAQSLAFVGFPAARIAVVPDRPEYHLTSQRCAPLHQWTSDHLVMTIAATRFGTDRRTKSIMNHVYRKLGAQHCLLKARFETWSSGVFRSQTLVNMKASQTRVHVLLKETPQNTFTSFPVAWFPTLVTDRLRWLSQNSDRLSILCQRVSKDYPDHNLRRYRFPGP